MPPQTTTPSRVITVSPLTPTTFSPFGQVTQNPSTHAGEPHLEHTPVNQGTAHKWLEVVAMDNHYHLGRSQKPATVSMNMFVSQPRELQDRAGKPTLPVPILERHPFTPQTFVPMGLDPKDDSTRFLVIVAPTLPLSTRSRGADDQQPPYPVPQPRRKPSLRERLLGARPNPFTNDFVPTTTPASSSASRPRPKGPGLPDLTNLKAFVARGDQSVTYGPGTWHAPMVVLGEREMEFVTIQWANGVGEEDCQEVEVRAGDGGEGVGVVVDGDGEVKAKL